MLAGLTVQNIVLIDRLELSLAAGLTALTGETGAGKSILLDALGLALGARAEGGLVRAGATQAVATAAFTLPERHVANAILEEQGIERDDLLILRRQLGADGKSRAFVNDQPVSVALLRRIGESLIEIEGQFEVHGLLDPATVDAALGTSGVKTSPDTSLGLLDGCRWATAATDVPAVLDHCRSQLADFKVPQYVTVVADALPRNAGGKLLKAKLRGEVQWGAPLR